MDIPDYLFNIDNIEHEIDCGTHKSNIVRLTVTGFVLLVFCGLFWKGHLRKIMDLYYLHIYLDLGLL